MKTMTCRQLGGACDKGFTAATFDEVAEMSKSHAVEMFQRGDEEHLEAMRRMKGLMSDPEAMNKWMEERRREFESLPEEG